MKVVWSNGVFDVVHLGHVKLLEFAKLHGEKLIVGIDGDERVTQRKGKGRPINNAKARKEMLLALKCVDEVVVFDDEHELLAHLLTIKPDAIVVGEEYKGKVVGQEVVKNIIYFPKIEGISTTEILNQIL